MHAIWFSVCPSISGCRRSSLRASLNYSDTHTRALLHCFPYINRYPPQSLQREKNWINMLCGILSNRYLLRPLIAIYSSRRITTSHTKSMSAPIAPNRISCFPDQLRCSRVRLVSDWSTMYVDACSCLIHIRIKFFFYRQEIVYVFN